MEESWEPIHRFRDDIHGVAVCTRLQLIVTAKGDTVLEIRRVCGEFDDGLEEAPRRMELVGKISCLSFFIPPGGGGLDADTPLLLVSNLGKNAVHVVDVASTTHKMDLAPPGKLYFPRGVAGNMGSRGPSSLIAVSQSDPFFHGVSLFAWSSSSRAWGVVRLIVFRGTLFHPGGLRFTGDGTTLCVADAYCNCLRLFDSGSGEYVVSLPTSKSPKDAEEVEDGWMVLCRRSSKAVLEFVKSDGSVRRALSEFEVWSEGKVSLARIPGVGIAVNCRDGVTVYASASVAAMLRMAPIRVAWMVAVARAILF